MRIAVIEHSHAGDYAEYIFSLLQQKAKENNYQVKTWISSVPAFQQQVAADALIYIYVESTSPILLNWLYKVKIPSILKKSKAEIVIDLNGITSDKIKIPQITVADQFLYHSNTHHLNSVEKFAFKELHQSANIAENIFSYSKKKLDGVQENKLQTIPFSAPAVFKAFEWHEKIMVKAQHADNKEYFIAVIEDDAVNDFVLLLQAFSKFKKWQQSAMQLLVLAKYDALSQEIKTKHATYKYKEDVRLVEEIEEKKIAALFASAYAFIHVAEKKPHLLVIAIAVECSLPIISFKNDDVKEYADDAVLFYNEQTVDALGKTIIKLYRDENLHKQLKEKAQQQAAFLNRETCENKLWQLLQTAARS